MYKFTNGIVVFDVETRDKYINAGMVLVKENEDVERTTRDISEEVKPVKSEGFGGLQEGTKQPSVENGRWVRGNKPKIRK